MSVAHLGSSSDAVTADADVSLVVTAPGGSGGRLLALGHCIDARTISPPSGWDEVVNDSNGSVRTYIWHRADDAASDYTFTLSGGFAQGGVQMYRYSGASTDAPAYSISTGPNDTSQTPDTLADVVAGSMMIWGLYSPGNSGPCTTSKGSERIDYSSATGPVALYGVTEDNTAGGSTTGATITSTGFGAKRLFSIAIPPDGGGGGGSILPLVACDMRNISDIGGMRG